LLLRITPGPNRRRGQPSLDEVCARGYWRPIGVAAGRRVHAIVAALGLACCQGVYPAELTICCRWIGVGYLLYLRGDLGDPARKKAPGSCGRRIKFAFWAAPFQRVNPKSNSCSFISVVPGFHSDDFGAGRVAFKAAALGAGLCRDCNHDPRQHSALASKLRTLPDRRDAPEVGSAVNVTRAGDGRHASWARWSTRRI